MNIELINTEEFQRTFKMSHLHLEMSIFLDLEDVDFCAKKFLRIYIMANLVCLDDFEYKPMLSISYCDSVELTIHI